MDLPQRFTRKLDERLQQALAAAKDDDRLRVVMVLAEQGRGAERGSEPDPAAFSSRSAYRQAMLKQRGEQIARDTQATKAALEKLDLAVRGGTAGRTVVVDGAAKQILASLALDGVSHVALDQRLGLIEPDRKG